MASRILFRVDGNAEIGLGHLVRCIALAQMLKSEFEIFFFSKSIPVNILNDLAQHNFKVIEIGTEDEFFDQIENHDIVILDGYQFDTSYQQKIKAANAKLVCIDDLHENEFVADLVINHAPDVVPADYAAQHYTQFALGLDYVLLRPAFLNKKFEKPDSYRALQTVFICFGGADMKNLTTTVVEVIKADTRLKRVIVVVGEAYSFLDQLKQTIADDIRIELYNSVDEEIIATLMQQADFVIVPSSGILQEALALDCRAISGMYVENQRNIFNSYKNLETFISAEDFSKENIKLAINKLFQSPERINKRVIDRKSGERLLKLFRKLDLENRVQFRRAAEDDLLKTFEWASSSEIRKFSFNTEPIPFENHKKWFLNKINDEKCFYYLGTLEGHAFGSVRFEVIQSRAIINYLVDPDYQKRGLGLILLKRGLDLFLSECKNGISTIIGEVIAANTASVKIFEKLGYDSLVDPATKELKFIKVINPGL